MDVYQIFRSHMGVWSWREVVGFILLACVAGALLFFGVRRRRLRKSQAVSWFILVLYLGIVFASTIFTRTVGARRYELVPFWSWYEMITTGNLGLFEQIRLNCLLLAPVGVLLPFALGYEFSPKYALAVGILIAAVIEVGQLALARGLFEWDDMIHNGIGCMAGCVVGDWMWGRIKKRRKEIL